MTLDVVQHLKPFFKSGRIEVRPQEPEASSTVLIHQAVDLLHRGAGLVIIVVAHVALLDLVRGV
jgi:hypothetical protein